MKVHPPENATSNKGVQMSDCEKVLVDVMSPGPGSHSKLI